MNRMVSVMVGSALMVAGLFMLLRQPAPVPGIGSVSGAANSPQPAGDNSRSRTQRPSLLIYCAASNRPAMEAVRTAYEAAYDVAIDIQYGPSQTLLSTIEVGRTGDLYLPADDSYLDMARSKGLLEEQVPLAQMTGVVGVAKGNPRQINSFSDLLRDDVRLVQANPDAAAVGKQTRDALVAAGLWDSLNSRTIAFRTTVQDVANDLKVGAADAGILYDAVLVPYPELEAVRLPELEPVSAQVTVGVLSTCQQPTTALHFVRYLSSRDKGLAEYSRMGFNVVEGDLWQERPELTLFAGSMLRPAVESTVRDFEAREGVRVTTVYNGCGILVGQMNAGQVPDAYFACDNEFMQQVKNLFPAPVSVAQNELVILVKKGNPFQIASLKDLAQPNLRVGIGHEKQCAMGWLTQRTLTEGGVKDEVMANVAVQTPSGDMLVNQMQAGSLDAAVVYVSNAVGAGDEFDAVRIVDLPCSIAIQPLAVAASSPHRQLAERLAARFKSAQSKQRFEGAGFSWKLQ